MKHLTGELYRSIMMSPGRMHRAVLALAFGFFIAACSPATTRYESPGDIAREPAITSVSVPELASDPEQYIGRTVVIAGEVNRVLGPRWFTIGGEEFGGNEVLVLGRSTVPEIVNILADSAAVMNDIVQVTGVVRVFEEDALEREIPGIDLDGDIFDPFDAEPVIVMTDMDLTPRLDVVPAVAVPVPVPVAVPVVREVDVFVPDPKPLAGRSATLFDVRVDSVLGNRAFWIGRNDGQRLLVVLDESATSGANDMRAHASTLKSGDMIHVTGVLHRMPSNLDSVRNSWGIGMTADQALRDEAIYLHAHRMEPVRHGAR